MVTDGEVDDLSIEEDLVDSVEDAGEALGFNLTVLEVIRFG